MSSGVLLDIKDLVVEYAVREGRLRVVDKASLNVNKGEIMALVGESGCGKSSLVDAVMGTLPPNGYIVQGQILFKGKDLLKMNRNELKRIRWEKIAMVFQAAQNSLNPVLRISDHFLETVKAHSGLSDKEILKKASELLEMVRLNPRTTLNAYPHELSGGMKQRVILALSLMLDPELLILDEPTSALDTLTQSTILDMLKEIYERKRITMFIVTHDLPIVAEIAHRAAVMYAGKIVEITEVNKLFHNPKHPYTRSLIKAIPSIIGDVSSREPIPGNPPSLLNPPSGCRFHPRCYYAMNVCKKKEPPFLEVNGGKVACWLYTKERGEAD